MWKYRGQRRPNFAVIPAAGQESVWDYPRPPALLMDERQIEIYYGGQEIASSSKAYRVLETASPPSFYLPPEDVNFELLISTPENSICEWKGMASYWTLSSRANLGVVGWSYPEPKPAFEKIRNYVSFYPAVLACYVSGEWPVKRSYKPIARSGQFIVFCIFSAIFTSLLGYDKIRRHPFYLLSIFLYFKN